MRRTQRDQRRAELEKINARDHCGDSERHLERGIKPVGSAILQALEDQHQHRGAGHGADAAGRHAQRAGHAPVARRDRGGDDVEIGDLEQAEAEALNDHRQRPARDSPALLPDSEMPNSPTPLSAVPTSAIIRGL